MPDAALVSGHYSQGGLLAAIEAGVQALGKTPETVTLDDLGPVEEFHIGGRAATRLVVEALKLQPGAQVLDVGCGLGGPARFVASAADVQVAGIDLTPEYIETGLVLNRWVGLADRVCLAVGDATALPQADASMDAAYMLHVGMNIADKPRLAAELAGVVKPGGRIVIYDVMLTGDPDLAFPVPWATNAAGSVVEAPDVYRQALTAAALTVVAEESKRDFALDFFARQRQALAKAGGPPPLGLHLVMGESRAEKVANMVENISQGRLAPFMMVAEKP